MLKEDACAGATSAAAVATVPMRLGVGKVKRVVPMTKKAKKLKTPIKEATFSSFLKEYSDDPNSADVIGKLSQNAKISDDLEGDSVATYGLETDDGSIVKVLVALDQAEDFEAALSDALKDAKDNTEKDIAEVLFGLNDDFHIVDVVWPSIQEDEEQATPDPAAQGQAGAGAPTDPAADPMDPNADPAGAGGDPAAGADPLADPNADPMADPMAGDDEGMDGGMDDVKSALKQVVDLLVADSEARKAEAEAKQAEARAREAEAAAQASEIKMKGEEEILDAETYYNGKKDEDKEAGRLKMLAKYRQEVKGGSDMDSGAGNGQAREVDMGGSKAGGKSEEEEETLIRRSLLKLLRGY